MENQNLLLFTNTYPYGKGETFLHTELNYISHKFGKIIIFPISIDKENGVRTIPQNASVVDLFEHSNYSLGSVLPSKIIQFFGLLFSEISGGNLSLNNLKLKVSQILRIIYKSKLLGEWIQKSNYVKSDSIFYSYWFSEWATVISLLGKEEINKRFFSRAHGFEIYEIQGSDKSIPFRKLQLKSIKKVFTVSDDGKDHLVNKNPTHSNKIEVARLGTEDRGIGFFEKSKFRIVSCSSLIPLKRINKLVEALSYIDYELEWVHFGDGAEFENIKRQVSELPKNIKVDLKGFVKNAEVLDYYKKNSVSLFVNLSYSEGVPVSIMEAISFGIPILATDVGGVSEVVSKEFCKLVSSDFETKTIADEITEFLNSTRNSEENRSSVRKFWENNFSAQSNYTDFYQMINS